MRILLLTENWPPRVGGIENYLFHIARELPRASVTVVAPSVPQASSDQPEGGIVAINRYRFFWPLLRPAWVPLFIKLYRQQKREPADVILCGKALLEGLIGYYLHKFLGIPYIVFTYAMEIESWAHNPWHARQLRRVLKAAQRVVYINDVTKERLLALGVLPAKLVKIWPGVDDAFFLATTESVKIIQQKYSLTTPYILCVSRLVARKGIDVLIEAFSRLDQTKYGQINLVIAGEGPELQRLQELAKKNYVAPSIRFLGAVPVAELVALYQESLFFALTPIPLPQDFEGFGIVYLEAAAAGKCSLGSRTGGVSEAVVHEQTGILVEPGDVAATTEGLTMLLHNESMRDSLAKQAQARAQREFKWSKRILLVKGVIDSVVMERRRASRQAS